VGGGASGGTRKPWVAGLPAFFWELSPRRAEGVGSDAIIASRMMIIAKRGKATQTSYSTAGRALAESIKQCTRHQWSLCSDAAKWSDTMEL
jgi:hypothetical protein